MPAQDHRAPDHPTPRRHSIIHLQGGSNTYVHRLPSEIEQQVTEARVKDSATRARTLIYIQDAHLPSTSVIIDPHQVVSIFGVIAPEDRTDSTRGTGLTSLTYSQAKQ